MTNSGVAGNRSQDIRRGSCQRYLPREESTESSTSSEESCRPHYHHGSIPRLIITLDRENEQLHEDLSPDTPGCPLELRDLPPPRPIPVFTFTCEDFDERHSPPSLPSPCSDVTSRTPSYEEPPPVPRAPACYDRSSDSDATPLPPQMRPIDTRLTLDLFNSRRCTANDECVSACECCRTPQPDPQPIPYIDAPDSEPLIYETPPEGPCTPKIRRILPQLSLDRPDEKPRPETVDAVCQTPSSPMPVMQIQTVVSKPPKATPVSRKLELTLDVRKEAEKIEDVHSRLKRTLFDMSRSFSMKSEDTELPSTATYSASESNDEPKDSNDIYTSVARQSPLDCGATQILDSVDRKSWKSPDEFRPAFGKVKALAKHFNNINLTYCVRNYKRHCQSSPNLSARVDKTIGRLEIQPTSASLADIQYESTKTDTSETGAVKLSEDEVKSILIQLEDWSKYGSRGSEDTLAHGNEFELENLPSEECSELANGLIFNEIVDKKPRRITLENIKLKSNQYRDSRESARSRESVERSESLEKTEVRIPRVVAMIPHRYSSLELPIEAARSSDVMRSLPELNILYKCPAMCRRNEESSRKQIYRHYKCKPGTFRLHFYSSFVAQLLLLLHVKLFVVSGYFS